MPTEKGIDYIDIPVAVPVKGVNLKQHKSVVVARKGVGSITSRVIDACTRFFGAGHLEVEKRKIYKWKRK